MPSRPPLPGRPAPRPTDRPTDRGGDRGGDSRPRRNRPPEPPRAATREQAAAYVNPTPDELLTPDDREEIQILLQLENRGYDKAVNEWVSLDPETPGAAEDAASGARVFYCSELANRTFHATGRLISATENKIRGIDRGTGSGLQRFHDLERHKNRLAAIRAQAKAIRATLFNQKAEEAPKNQARRVLGDLYPVTLSAIRNRIKAGEPADDVLADYKARGVGESWSAERARGDRP